MAMQRLATSRWSLSRLRSAGRAAAISASMAALPRRVMPVRRLQGGAAEDDRDSERTV